jgi:hypothetical protein
MVGRWRSPNEDGTAIPVMLLVAGKKPRSGGSNVYGRPTREEHYGRARFLESPEVGCHHEKGVSATAAAESQRMIDPPPGCSGKLEFKAGAGRLT